MMGPGPKTINHGANMPIHSLSLTYGELVDYRFLAEQLKLVLEVLLIVN